MRTAAIPLAAAVLAACAEHSGRKAPAPADRAVDEAVAAAVAADYPLLMRADPEATNYAPPGWPFEPGARISHEQLVDLGRFGRDDWDREAVVWVVSESGLEGALPFGAVYTNDPDHDPCAEIAYEECMRTMAWARQDQIYHGHVPVRARHWAGDYTDLSELEELLPPSLRGRIDHRKHILTLAWNKRRKSYRLNENFYAAQRERYYGPGASW